MKIAYFIEGEIDVSKPNSVLNKVIRQTTIWLDEGHPVWIFSLQTGSCLEVKSSKIVYIGKEYTKSCSAIKKITTIVYNSYKFSKYIKKLSIDIIYSRLVTYTPILEVIFRRIPAVLEINSNDKAEYSGTAYSKYTRLYTSLLGRRLKDVASAFVFVTHELAGLYQRDLTRMPKYSVIANGYDFGRVPNLIESPSSRVSLVFIISPGLPWHGLDHLIELAKNLPEYDFHVVGETGNDTTNMFYHGYKTGRDLDNILLRSHIGIASLALERAGLSEACPLKSREYFNYGLPCFGSYVDTDFIDIARHANPIYKKITNIEDYAKSEGEIRQFVEGWIKQFPYKDDVRRNAMSLLDDRVKEKLRLELFNEILQRR